MDQFRWRQLTAVFTASTSLLLGCVGNSAGRWADATSTNAPPYSAAPAKEVHPQGSNISTPLLTPEKVAQANSSSTGVSDGTWMGSVSSVYKKTTSGIAGAMTIHPKVVPAKDPTSLATPSGPVGPDLYVAAAHLYENQGKMAEAREKYEQALKLAPHDTKILISYARLHHRQGNFDEAVRTYQRVLKVDPRNTVALNDLALCHARQGNVSAAASQLAKAVQLDPSSKLYRNNYAAVLVEQNHIDEAFGHLAHAHGEAVAHYNLGFLLLQRDDREQAIAHFRQAQQLSPGLAQAGQALAQLGAAPVASSGYASPQMPPQRQQLPQITMPQNTSSRIPAQQIGLPQIVAPPVNAPNSSASSYSGTSLSPGDAGPTPSRWSREETSGPQFGEPDSSRWQYYRPSYPDDSLQRTPPAPTPSWGQAPEPDYYGSGAPRYPQATWPYSETSGYYGGQATLPPSPDQLNSFSR